MHIAKKPPRWVALLTKFSPSRLEPTSGNCQPVENRELAENQNPVLSTSLDKTLQKYPEIERIITAWPELPEHIKAAIKAMIQAYKGGA
jgi:hypothetical protein